MDWLQLVTLVAGSSVVATLTSRTFDHVRQRQQISSETGYLALRVSFELESYAADCADFVVLWGNVRTGATIAVMTELPKLPELPESDRYVNLPRDLLHEILELPQLRSSGQKGADEFLEHVGDEDKFQGILAEHAIRLGNKALNIARRLRSENHLPPRNFSIDGGWNYRDFLFERLAAANALKE